MSNRILVITCIEDQYKVLGTMNSYPFSYERVFNEQTIDSREMVLRATADMLGYPQSVLDFEDYYDSTTEWEDLPDAEIIPEFEDRDPEQFSDREHGENDEGESGSD